MTLHAIHRRRAGVHRAARRLLVATCGAWLGVCLTSATAWAQQPPAAGDLPADAIVARVDGEPIKQREVERLLRQSLAGRTVSPPEQVIFAAQTLEQLVNRKLVDAELRRQEVVATDDDVTGARRELELRLTAAQVKLADFLARQGLTEAEFEAQLRWELAWKKFVAAQLTDQRLENYFNEHRRQFDGTRLRASHVLLRVSPAGEPTALQATVQLAARLRAQIVAGDLSFADAVARYSAGPSRHEGGDLGFIPRHDLMVEAFSAALFALQPGEISQPVVTPFGVHLIQCTEVEPGQLPWTEARQRLEPAAAQHLFNELANQARATARVEYTGVAPYLDPASRRVVAPAGNR